MKNSEIAEKAAEILETKGWTKDTYVNPLQGYCLMGATFCAMGWTSADEITKELDGRAAAVLWPALGKGECRWNNPHVEAGQIIAVNDRDITGKADAIEFVMKAAKYWRDKGE